MLPNTFIVCLLTLSATDLNIYLFLFNIIYYLLYKTLCSDAHTQFAYLLLNVLFIIFRLHCLFIGFN